MSIAMSPKTSKSHNLSVIAASTLTLAERRALRGIGAPSGLNGPPAVAAVSSLPPRTSAGLPTAKPRVNHGDPAPPSISSTMKRNARALDVAASSGSASSAARITGAFVGSVPTKPLRADMPTIKNTRRGGVSKALDAHFTVGMHSLVEDLDGDREAASGKGVRSSHLATWTTFHHRL